jgi:hypothetical protein
MDLHPDRLWHVGVVDAPVARFLEPSFRPEIEWLPRPPFGQFWADPFAAFDGDALCLFAEAYDYARRTGCIVCARRAGGRWSPPVTAFAPGHHVSYPFLFAHAGGIVTVPEQVALGKISLYEVDLRRGRFGREIGCIDGFPGADPVLFAAAGLFWILASRDLGGRRSALHAFYAENVAGPYRAHAGNPLLQGNRFARNAGTPFQQEGSWYRPAQDAARRYGHAIDIMRIVELSPQRFEQEPVARVEPWDARHRLGVHTLSAAGGVTLVDGLRAALLPASLRALLARRAGVNA